MKRVFICYCREDGDFADNLRHKLEEAEIPTWQDTDLYGGQPWRAEIDLAIREASAVVVIVSPDAIRSAYVNYEWAFALGAGLNVVPVLLKIAPDALHPALESRQCLDFSQRSARPWDLLFRAVIGTGPAAIQTTIRVPVGAPPVLEQAARALDSMHEEERAAALKTLDTMQHPAVVEVLAQAARHPIQEVRIAAGLSLLRYSDRRALPAIFEALRTGWSVDLDELARIDPQASGDLIEALRDTSSAIRRTAADALGHIRDLTSVPHLKKLLADPVPGVRESALSALGAFKDPALFPIFEEAYRNNNEPRVALDSVAAISGAQSENLLIEALRNSNDDVRARAASLLANRATSAAVPALVGALEDSSSEVRRKAVEALARHTDPTAINALLEALDDEDSGVRAEARRALADTHGPGVVSGLLQIVCNPDKIFRGAAVSLLGELGDESAVPVLMKALGNADTRSEAVEALGKFAKPGTPAVPTLVSLLSGGDDRLRRTVVEALGRIADPATVPALAGMLNDQNGDFLWVAKSALQRIGTPEAQKAIRNNLRERQASG